jgi:DNA-binding NtrC family response regulator/pSer/pThr/pTyr-binding forkhead associated (FHA) protein
MLRLTITADHRVRHIPLDADGPLRIGSAPDNEIVIVAPGVSRHHARIERTPQGLSIVDTSSKNGVVVGTRRMRNVVLVAGDAVRLGTASLTIESISTSDAELALRWPAEGSTSHAHVFASDTDTGGAMEDLTGPAAALQWARRVEQRMPHEIERDLASLVDDARTIVHADSLLVLERERDDVNIIATAGALPGDRDAALLAGGNAPGWRIFGRVAARVDGAPWKREFLEFVDAKLGAVLEIAGGSAPSRGEAMSALPAGIVAGPSPLMRALTADIHRIAASNIDVLLVGETGTGKELMARAIHELSGRVRGPFVPVNCAAVSSELLEAELFGIGRNVATGVDPRPGVFVAADGGTLLLDEISEMPPPLQAKLLRALQEREVLAVGTTRPRKVDVRVISSTNRDPESAVAAGVLRQDLYFRLRGIELRIPPLRSRTEDIPLLVHAFVRRAAAESHKRIRGISRRAMTHLLSWPWPGNVREMQHVIEAAVVRCPDACVIQDEHLGLASAFVQSPSPVIAQREELTLEHRVETAERDAIVAALRQCGGNKSRAARLLGITRAGLYLKLRRYQIE